MGGRGEDAGGCGNGQRTTRLDFEDGMGRSKTGNSEPGGGRARATRLIAAVAVGVVLMSVLAVHVTIAGGREDGTGRRLGNVLSPSAVEEAGAAAALPIVAHTAHPAVIGVVGFKAAAVAGDKKGEAMVRITMKNTASAAAREDVHAGAAMTTAAAAERGLVGKVKLTLSSRAKALIAAQARRDAAESRLAKRDAAKESAAYADVLKDGDEGAGEVPTAKLAELNKANAELAEYSTLASSGTVQYKKDTAAERRVSSPEKIESSKELLSRYGEIAGSGIVDGADQAEAVEKAAAGPAITPGQSVRAQSSSGHWRKASVAKVDGGKVLVHFEGYKNEYDEWIPLESARLVFEERPKMLAKAPHEAIHAPVAIVEASKVAPHAHAASATPVKLHAAHKASGLAEVCNTCLKDADVSAGERKEACGVCLGDRSMLQVSCNICSGASLKLIGLSPKNSLNSCEKECTICDACVKSASSACWDTCNVCQGCVRESFDPSYNVSAAPDAVRSGSSLSSSPHGRCTTCGALEIADSMAAREGKAHLGAREMQLASAPLSPEQAEMRVISKRLRGAGRLAAKLKENRVARDVRNDLAELREIEKSGTRIGAGLLTSMGGVARQVELQLRRKRAAMHAGGVYSATILAEGGNATGAASAGEATMRDSASSNATSAGTLENAEGATSQVVVVAEPLYGTPAPPVAAPAPEPERRDVAEPEEEDEPRPRTLPLAWSRASACPLPRLVIVREALCTEEQRVDGTCEQVWGDMPEIVGPVVALRMKRQMQENKAGEISFSVGDRVRLQGDFSAADLSGWGGVSSEAWVGSKPTLGSVQARESSPGVAPKIDWRGADGVTLASSVRSGFTSFFRQWPAMSVRDCKGAELAVVVPVNTFDVTKRADGEVMMHVQHREEVLSVVYKTRDLISEDQYQGEHLHVWAKVGDRDKGRIVGILKRQGDDWSAQVEAGGLLDPRLAVAVVAMFEEEARPAPPPPSPWWFPVSSTAGGGMGEALGRASDWFVQLFQGKGSSTALGRPGLWEGVFLWMCILVAAFALLACCGNCFGCCGIAVYGSKGLRACLTSVCCPCAWVAAWLAKCFGVCCGCCMPKKDDANDELESLYQGSDAGSVASRETSASKTFKPVWASWGGPASSNYQPEPTPWDNTMNTTAKVLETTSQVAVGAAVGVSRVAWGVAEATSGLMEQHRASESARSDLAARERQKHGVMEGKFAPGKDGVVMWQKPTLTKQPSAASQDFESVRQGVTSNVFQSQYEGTPSVRSVFSTNDGMSRSPVRVVEGGSYVGIASSHEKRNLLKTEPSGGTSRRSGTKVGMHDDSGIDALVRKGGISGGRGWPREKRGLFKTESSGGGSSKSVSVMEMHDDSGVDALVRRGGSFGDNRLLKTESLVRAWSKSVSVMEMHDDSGIDALVRRAAGRAQMCYDGVSVAISRTPSGDADVAVMRTGSGGSSHHVIRTSSGGTLHEHEHHVLVEEIAREKAGVSKVEDGIKQSERSLDSMGSGLGVGSAHRRALAPAADGAEIHWPVSHQHDASATPRRNAQSPSLSAANVPDDSPQGRGIAVYQRATSVASKSSRVSISDLMDEQARQREEFATKMASKKAKSKGGVGMV